MSKLRLFVSYLQMMMAKSTGEVTATMSQRQSFTRYAIPANNVLPNVQDRLSITPTSFLCSMSTHSTAGRNKKIPFHRAHFRDDQSI